jgi:hypothetical protein
MRSLLRSISEPLRKAENCLAVIAAAFIGSRLLFRFLGIRFDTEPLNFYWQYVDPALLQHDLWRSIFYLERQPPAYNLFLGAILHLAPTHLEAAYQAVYLGLGLALSLSLFALMDRMDVDRYIALAIALVFTLSPSTVLYENLLFYEQPLTSLFCVAALFLHRYASNGRVLDGFVFFSCLGLISGIRAIYHLAWFAAIAGFVVVALPQWRRRTLLAFSLPAILLLSFYAKHIIVFRNLVPGQGVYTPLNWVIVVRNRLPPNLLEPLFASGKISPSLKTNLLSIFELYSDTEVRDSALARLVPIPPKTGIAVLDECVKSTGSFNLNCVWAQDIADVYGKDARVVLRTYPRIYREMVIDNILRYCLPDTHGWPLDGRTGDKNADILARPLAVYNLFTFGTWPPVWNRPWLGYLALPVLLGFGCFRVTRMFRDVMRRHEKIEHPAAITLAFVMFNVLFLTVVVVLLSYGDHNRYRSEVSTYYALLLGMFLTSCIRRTRPQLHNT